jgi:hypothetical protein
MSLMPGGDPRYDIGRTGSPVWARRDDGPMNTYVPGPLSSEPLQSSYHSGMRLGISGVIFAVIIVFVVANGQAGVLGSVLILIGLWVLYVVPAWLRGRIGLRVDGSRCAVHGWFREVEFDGADVAKVQFVFGGRSPDVRLVLRDGRKVLVVASRLEKGHSTLYEWLRRYAPEADYDKRALDLRDTLVNRGLMGAPGDPWDEYGRVGPAPAEPGTTSDIEPSDTMKTSQPPEAKAPDSTETRTDDDEQA